MSMPANILLTKQIESILSKKLSSQSVLETINEIHTILNNFEVNQISVPQLDKADNLLQSYTSAMRIQGRSEKTITRYVYIINRLLKSAGVYTKQITVYHIRMYLSEEKERGISDSTLEGYRQVFSAYFGWLQRECLIQHNPTANLGVIKIKKKVVEVYTEVDIENMKYHCDCLRDRAIIEFLASTGCRISEMTCLDKSDIDLVNLECKVLGKGNKERTVYLSQVGAMLLEKYFSERSDGCSAVFIGKGTERISPGGVRAMLNKLSEKAGVCHVHPHKFRRTLATNLIRRGMSIQEVANILGHEKLDTTMRYVLLNKNEIKASYQKYM